MKKRLPISNRSFAQGEQLQVAENILMFFQQKFCRSISNPDMDRLKKEKKKKQNKKQE